MPVTVKTGVHLGSTCHQNGMVLGAGDTNRACCRVGGSRIMFEIPKVGNGPVGHLGWERLAV